jgi:phosphatidylinositol glycan class V
MAAPMLWILVQSSVTVLFPCLQQPVHGQRVSQESGTRGPKDEALVAYKIPELALPQLVLALTALTSFHVQIVNRIASGYPTWYVVLGTWIVDTKTTHSDDKVWRHNQWFVRGMMMYALIQGMLFANFLPPA